VHVFNGPIQTKTPAHQARVKNAFLEPGKLSCLAQPKPPFKIQAVFEGLWNGSLRVSRAPAFLRISAD
jgi:hypothetical protein